MEACLNYQSKCRVTGSMKFNFTGKSGSKWILTERWKQHIHKQYLCQQIKISTESRGIHRFYYADVEIYTEKGKLVLEKTRKGSRTGIEVYINTEEISLALHRIMETDEYPECDDEEETDKAFLYKIKLYPVMELQSAEKFEENKQRETNSRQSLIDDISTLMRDDILKDVAVISGNVSVRAHKSILAARWPGFYYDLFNARESKRQDGLYIVKVSPLAAPGLREMHSFAYTNEYSSLVSLGNMSIAAKEMGLVELQSMFLSELVEKLSIDTILYVIYINDVHGKEIYHSNISSFLYSHLAQIELSPAWAWYKVLSVCLWETSKRMCRSENYDKMEIIRLALRLVSLVHYS